mgnify:FL=1
MADLPSANIGNACWADDSVWPAQVLEENPKDAGNVPVYGAFSLVVVLPKYTVLVIQSLCTTLGESDYSERGGN